MTWYETQASDSEISYTEWNNMVDTIWCHGGISGSYVGHSGNTDIHFPSSNMRGWFDTIYSPSAGTTTYTSISSQNISGGTIQGSYRRTIYKTTGATYTASPGQIIIASGCYNTIRIDMPLSHTSGDYITVKKVDNVNNITLSGNGSTIDGDNTVTMSFQYESNSVTSDGSNWWLV